MRSTNTVGGKKNRIEELYLWFYDDCLPCLPAKYMAYVPYVQYMYIAYTRKEKRSLLLTLEKCDYYYDSGWKKRVFKRKQEIFAGKDRQTDLLER